MIVEGPAAIYVSDAEAIIAWKTDEAADSRILYGVGQGYGSFLPDPALVTDHRLTLRDLSALTTYHYQVQSTDAFGNGPIASQDATLTTRDEIDATPPVIIEGPVADSFSVLDTGVLIYWRTDEAATSKVDYGLSDTYTNVDYGDLPVQEHYRLLTGLLANTWYHYRASSTDPAGNGPPGQTNATNPAADRHFTTAGWVSTAPLIIVAGPDVLQASITHQSAVIQWRTNRPATSRVDYGTTSSYGMAAVHSELRPHHSMTITGLLPATTYHFRVQSVDGFSNLATSTDFVFTTDSRGDDRRPCYTSCPKITYASDRQAIVQWATDEFSDSYAEASPEVARAASAAVWASSTLVTDHRGIFTNLSPGTRYQIATKSRDPAGNVGDDRGCVATGRALTLLTAASPDEAGPRLLAGPTLEYATADFAILSWRADEAADALLELGPAADSYPYTKAEPEHLLERRVMLTGLAELGSPIVYYRLSLSDPSRMRTEVTGVFSLGAADTEAPTLENPTVAEVTSSTAMLEWATSEPATSEIEYGASTASYPYVVRGGAYERSHRVLLTGLAPAAAYHFRLSATDPSGNSAEKTGDLAFTTVSGPVPLRHAGLAVLAVLLGAVFLGSHRRMRTTLARPGSGGTQTA